MPSGYVQGLEELVLVGPALLEVRGEPWAVSRGAPRVEFVRVSENVPFDGKGPPIAGLDVDYELGIRITGTWIEYGSTHLSDLLQGAFATVGAGSLTYRPQPANDPLERLTHYLDVVTVVGRRPDGNEVRIELPVAELRMHELTSEARATATIPATIEARTSGDTGTAIEDAPYVVRIVERSLTSSAWGPSLLTTSGLTYGYLGGVRKAAGQGWMTAQAAGTIVLPADSVCFIERDVAGTVFVASRLITDVTNDAWFTRGRIPLARAFTGATSIGATIDHRVPCLWEVTPAVSIPANAVPLTAHGYTSAMANATAVIAAAIAAAIANGSRAIVLPADIVNYEYEVWQANLPATGGFDVYAQGFGLTSMRPINLTDGRGAWELTGKSDIRLWHATLENVVNPEPAINASKGILFDSCTRCVVYYSWVKPNFGHGGLIFGGTDSGTVGCVVEGQGDAGTGDHTFELSRGTRLFVRKGYLGTASNLGIELWDHSTGPNNDPIVEDMIIDRPKQNAIYCPGSQRPVIRRVLALDPGAAGIGLTDTDDGTGRNTTHWLLEDILVSGSGRVDLVSAGLNVQGAEDGIARRVEMHRSRSVGIYQNGLRNRYYDFRSWLPDYSGIAVQALGGDSKFYRPVIYRPCVVGAGNPYINLEAHTWFYDAELTDDRGALAVRAAYLATLQPAANASRFVRMTGGMQSSVAPFNLVGGAVPFVRQSPPLVDQG